MKHPDRVVRNEAELRAAWQAHQRELLAEIPWPGCRPWGFFRCELGIEPQTPLEGIEVLDTHGLLSPEDILAIETRHPALAASQTSYCTPERHRVVLEASEKSHP